MSSLFWMLFGRCDDVRSGISLVPGIGNDRQDNGKMVTETCEVSETSQVFMTGDRNLIFTIYNIIFEDSLSTLTLRHKFGDVFLINIIILFICHRNYAPEY